MKKLKLFVIGLFGIGMALLVPSKISSVSAEGEPACMVVIEEAHNGKVSADKLEGEAGEIVTLTIDPDILYLTESVSVNGTTLIESETNKGEYTFALTPGANTVSANFVINEELLGRFTDIVVEAQNKDWKNFFSIKNILTIVTWLFDTGLLVLVIRYYIKDKKLEKKVEEATEATLKKVLPDMIGNSMELSMQKAILPYFKDASAHDEETRNALITFSKCWALSVENTPESRRAILDELSSLKVSDNSALEATKKYIEEMTRASIEKYNEVMKRLNTISLNTKAAAEEVKVEEKPMGKELESKEEILEKEELLEKEHVDYDGTSI